jgi:hypothetical protein
MQHRRPVVARRGAGNNTWRRDRDRCFPTRPRPWLKIPPTHGVLGRLGIFGALMCVLLLLGSQPAFPKPLRTPTPATPGAVGVQCPLTYGELLAGGIQFSTLPGWPYDDLPSTCLVSPFSDIRSLNTSYGPASAGTPGGVLTTTLAFSDMYT